MESKYKNQLVLSFVQSKKDFTASVRNLIIKGLYSGKDCDFIAMEKYPHQNSQPSGAQIDAILPGFGLTYENPNTKEFGLITRNPFDLSISEQKFKDRAGIDKAVLKEKTEALRSVDSNSRIYIFAHGEKGADTIRCGNNSKLDYNALADVISANPKLQKETNKPVNISLIVCYGGADEPQQNHGESFAYKLSQALAKRKVYARISGRVEQVITVQKGLDIFKEVNGVHHGTGKKIYFESDPKSYLTLTREAIYGDNMGSISRRYLEIEKIYKDAKAASGSRKDDLIIGAKIEFATTAYDLAIDRNTYKSLGKEFDELNKIRWGKEGSIPFEKLYKMAQESLLKDMKMAIIKDPTHIRDREKQYNMLQNYRKNMVEKQDFNGFNFAEDRIADFKKNLEEDIKAITNGYDKKTLEKINSNTHKSKDGVVNLMEKYQKCIEEVCSQIGLKIPKTKGKDQTKTYIPSNV